MRLISLLTILIIFLSGCGTKAPQPPVVPECGINASIPGAPYVHCKMPDGTKLDIPIEQANKYICTTPEGYTAGKLYEKQLNDWILQHCTNQR